MSKLKRNSKVYDFNQILEEYKPQDDDIMTKEDERISNIKHVIYDQLPVSERNILLLYTEMGSVRKVAKELFVSPSTVWLAIKEIQTKIKNKLNN